MSLSANLRVPPTKQRGGFPHCPYPVLGEWSMSDCATSQGRTLRLARWRMSSREYLHWVLAQRGNPFYIVKPRSGFSYAGHRSCSHCGDTLPVIKRCDAIPVPASSAQSAVFGITKSAWSIRNNQSALPQGSVSLVIMVNASSDTFAETLLGYRLTCNGGRKAS